MVKVSVVVAVYQVERYIVKCLNSLVNQTLKDFEVLLIDDGSTDLSGSICDEFAKKDSRFKVYHKKNEGVGAARQMGLEKSIGEYIIHVDPDDWAESSMLEELYATAKREKADVVICDYFKNVDEKNSCYMIQKPNLAEKKGYFIGLLGPLYGACWNKLVRRGCFSEFGIFFVKEMSLWEDKLLNLKLAEQPIKVTYLPKAFYHYFIRSDSTIRSQTKENVCSMMLCIDWLERKKDLYPNELLINLKKNIKRVSFGLKTVNSSEFKGIYPEIDHLFSFKINEIGRSEDFYIFLATRGLLSFSRFIFHKKECIAKKVRSLLWRR